MGWRQDTKSLNGNCWTSTSDLTRNGESREKTRSPKSHEATAKLCCSSPSLVEWLQMNTTRQSSTCMATTLQGQ